MFKFFKKKKKSLKEKCLEELKTWEVGDFVRIKTYQTKYLAKEHTVIFNNEKIKIKRDLLASSVMGFYNSYDDLCNRHWIEDKKIVTDCTYIVLGFDEEGNFTLGRNLRLTNNKEKGMNIYGEFFEKTQEKYYFYHLNWHDVLFFINNTKSEKIRQEKYLLNKKKTKQIKKFNEYLQNKDSEFLEEKIKIFQELMEKDTQTT